MKLFNYSKILPQWKLLILKIHQVEEFAPKLLCLKKSTSLWRKLVNGNMKYAIRFHYKQIDCNFESYQKYGQSNFNEI